MRDTAEEAILQNQNILPAQFFPGRAERARTEPLERLAFAVLVDAVHVFQCDFGALQPSRRRQFNEAEEWLLGPQGQGPFSLENVCYLLDVDPLLLRKSLRRWQANKRAGRACQALARRSPVSHMRSLRPRPRHRVERRA